MLLHLGIAGLMGNEIYVTLTNQESRMTIVEGETAHESLDVRATELAITLAILQGGLTADESVAKLKSGKYTKVPFGKTMPAYITYFTMAQDIDGKLRTFSDIYGRDAAVLRAMDAPRKANRSRVTGEQIIPIENDPRDLV